MSNEAKTADATAASATVPVPTLAVTRNGVTVQLNRDETERAREGAEKVNFWNCLLGQLTTEQDKAKRDAAIVAAAVKLLGVDSEGNSIAVDYLQSKLSGSLLAYQKDKGKDTFDMTTKGNRAVSWFDNLSVARAVAKSPIDISLAEMTTACMDSAKAFAAKKIDAAQHQANLVAAGTKHQKRVQELQDAAMSAIMAQAMAAATPAPAS